MNPTEIPYQNENKANYLDYTNSDISILILDYHKSNEAKNCLESIKTHCKFPYFLIYCSNGGPQDYVWDLYGNYKIDQLILNRQNNGLGFATSDLFKICPTKYCIYWQVDQVASRDISEYEINQLTGFLAGNSEIGAISLCGYNCGFNTYSDRCHITKTSLYNSIKDMPNGGCGPFNANRYNENRLQQFYSENNLKFLSVNNHFVRDAGIWTIRELPCGGIVKMKTDTKETFWLKNPKEKYIFPEMSDVDWNLAIRGEYPPGKIPDLMKHLSFKYWR